MKETHAARMEEVARFGPMVSTLARRMIRDPETARDAAQEAWVEISRDLEAFGGRSRLSTWVYSVAARAILHAARHERIYTTRVLSGFFHGPEREAPAGTAVEHQVWVRSMCDACLTGMLHCLDSRQRLAYILREIVGLSYDEVAVVLETDEAVVRQMVSRGRRKLNHFLRDECVLKNPQAKCACRMRRHVEALDLPAQYRKLYDMIGRASVFSASQEVLPTYDYWKPLLDL